ncbi:MAG TPA: GNAT family N-acetyltransferase [Candidatus Dormibacteraeota bacterium]|nr:GNAT family N-acetyltransferase [Candidatus Dormibacteraeota bacterium]
MQLRPAIADDARAVADLETARTPDEPRSAAMIAYWWTHMPEGARWLRLVDQHVYVEASHDAWVKGERRFGWVWVTVHPDAWTADLYRAGVERCESWLLQEAAQVASVEVREDFARELDVLAGLGYREERRERFWELDLVGRREVLLAAAERSRAEMRRLGVELVTLEGADDESTLRQVFELDVATTQDVPTTVPIYRPSFEEWRRNYFENPAIRLDRFWVARVEGELAGMSLIAFPPERGVPSTEFTGVAAKFRGRGIARALKYQTVAQAIAIGATRLRTDNDSTNAPILHINAEMGYVPITPYLELHRDLR